MSWNTQKKKEGFFVPFILSQGIFFWNLCFVSMYTVLNALSEYKHFYISKNIISYTIFLVVKICRKPSVYP